MTTTASPTLATCRRTRCSPASASVHRPTIARIASSTRISTSYESAGYLTVPCPRELGGGGLSLADVCRAQRRLAYYAPGHGACRQHAHLLDGRRRRPSAHGRRSLEWLLREAVAGEIFAAGHAESGNDLPVLSVDREPSASRRLPHLGPQDVQQPDPGVDPPGRACHGHARSRAAQSRPRVRTARRRWLHRARRHGTRSACARPEATTRSWRGPSSPTATSRACCRRGASTHLLGLFSPTRCSTSAPSTTRSPSGRATWRSPRPANGRRWR